MEWTLQTAGWLWGAGVLTLLAEWVYQEGKRAGRAQWKLEARKLREEIEEVRYQARELKDQKCGAWRTGPTVCLVCWTRGVSVRPVCVGVMECPRCGEMAMIAADELTADGAEGRG